MGLLNVVAALNPSIASRIRAAVEAGDTAKVLALADTVQGLEIEHARQTVILDDLVEDSMSAARVRYQSNVTRGHLALVQAAG